MIRTPSDVAVRARRRAIAVLVAVGGTLALAGCSPTVTLTPAPGATSIGCAGIIARTAQISALGAAPLRQTDQQGTAAWGDPVSVVLKCGVASPAPSKLFCLTVDGVDWLEQDRNHGKVNVLTTFGRTPATEVTINAVTISGNDVLPPLSDAIISAIPNATRHCVGSNAGLGTATPTPSASATPTPTSSPSPTPTPSATPSS